MTRAGDCDAIETHTACPVGYLAWHEWAERMARTHRCTRCKVCGFYAIWTSYNTPDQPKRGRVRAETSVPGVASTTPGPASPERTEPT